MKIVKNIFKYIILLIIGGSAYCGIELLWRGHTHWTMLLVGGLSFIFCGCLNEVFKWKTPIWLQMLICSCGITIIELISGIFINLVFKLNVWDYSNLPFNILGQVSLLYSVAWFFLSVVAIVVDDWLRYWLFNEEKPKYYFK